MMEQTWNRILERFGQEVTLREKENSVSLRAIVQPWLDSGKDQVVHEPLGLGRRDRFRYLGPVQCPVSLDTVVEWGGREFRVQTAHLVGDGICPHWWAVLYPREEAAL